MRGQHSPEVSADSSVAELALNDLPIRPEVAPCEMLSPSLEGLKIITRELCVSKNFGQKSWADDFAGVHRNCGRSAIRMPKEMMTALDPGDFETGTFER